MRDFSKYCAMSLVSCCMIALGGCVQEKEGSLFDPDVTFSPAPIISSVTPSVGLAGVTEITISGLNFSSNLDRNVVFFDATPVAILQASTTQLLVKAPVIVKDSIRIRAAVHGSNLFSDPFYYTLDAAVAEYADIAHDPASPEEPWAIELDDSGNLYFSLTTNNIASGVKKYTPAGVRSDYAPPGPVLRWQTMRFNSGTLFGSRILQAIYEIPPGANPVIWVSGSGLGRIYDFDIDAAGNIWGGGNNTSVYRITPSKNVKSFPFNANVRGVRVYNGYVYFGGRRDSLEKVWRFELVNSDSLGSEEVYFDFSSAYGINGPMVNALTFSNDGDLYIGTDAPGGVIVVHPDKSHEQLYDGLVPSPVISLAWDTGNFLYATKGKTSTSPQAIYRINMQKSGAPYFGR